MSSSRSSKLLIAIAALVLAAGVAGAVTVEQSDVPADAEVGTTVTATFVLSDLYGEYNTWQLEGSTELENVTWTVQNIDLSDQPVGEATYDGSSFAHPVDKSAGVASVRVEVTGRVPEVENWSYDPAQTFVMAGFQQVRQGGTSSTIETVETHHYTADSQEARQAIDDAQAAIAAAGGHAGAEERLGNAVSAYQAGNFGNAVDLANQARQTATQAKQSSQRTQLLLYAGAGVIGLVAVVGGVFWWRSKQTAHKL